jgi:hypothetical protein
MKSIQRITPAVLLTLAFALPAEADPAQAATVDIFQSIQANALFRDVEQIVCADGSTNTLETDVAVLTDTNTDHPIGQPRTTTVGSSAQVTISNFCNGDFQQASANATNFDFTQNGLTSASLTATYDLVALGGNCVRDARRRAHVHRERPGECFEQRLRRKQREHRYPCRNHPRLSHRHLDGRGEPRRYEYHRPTEQLEPRGLPLDDRGHALTARDEYGAAVEESFAWQ